MRQLAIDGTLINNESPCYVIAEIGHNHQGNLKTAKELFWSAKECGANAVKLQKRDNRALYTKAMYGKLYDNENSFGQTYGEHREALEFGIEEYRELQDYAKEIEITMFATAFDFPSVDFLAKLDIPAIKIASGDLKNIPLLTYVAALQKPMIVSTGGATMTDVQRAYDAVMPINSQLCIMQCTSGYPAAFEEMNLRVITTYRERFPNVIIGLSGHDNGISMAVASYMLGARVIEKHFTLNRASKGTDHAFSLEPTGLSKMVRYLNRIPAALGDGVKRVYDSEINPMIKMGKKLVTARALSAGHCLREEDILIKSPGDGLPPYELDKIVGRVLLKDMEEDEAFSFSILNGTQNWKETSS